MQARSWSDVPAEQLNPLLSRQVIHTGAMTVARLVLLRCAFVPVHAHVNEQVCMVQSGCLKFVVDGKEVTVSAGQVLELPPNVPHSAEALEDSVAIDLFTPAREDWIRGEDAYLRG